MAIEGKEILDTFARDQEAGFRLLTSRYMRPLYWHIRRLVVWHPDAEDALQETLLRAYKALGSLRDGSLLTAWLYRIATNEALRLIDAGSRAPRAVGGEADAEASQALAEEYVDYSDLEAVKLRDAVLTLPPRQQATFNMRYFDSLGYPEIARALGCTEATAKANYHFAKEKIIRYINSISLQ